MPSFRRRLRRNRRWLVPLLRLVLLVCGVLLLAGAAVALQTLQAKHALDSARTALVASRTAVQQGDVATARSRLAVATKQGRRAEKVTSYPWWRAYAHLPFAGSAVREVRGLTRETKIITSDVLPPLVDSVGGPREPWTGKLDIAALSRLTPELLQADSSVTASLRRIRELPYCQIRRVDDARDDLDAAVLALAREVRDAAVMSQVLPVIFGRDRPGRVLLVAQNNAEERATGGLIGAYALLRTDKGAFRLEKSGSNRDLVDASTAVADLGADFRARYGEAQAASTWRSANLTPDTASAGTILAGLAARQLHVAVDAVLFVDPVSLADLLRATGPVTLAGGGRMSADNAPRLLLHDLYEAYPSAEDDERRDDVFDQALRAVVQKLQRPGTPRAALVRGLRHAVTSGHLQVYATDARAEMLLRQIRAGGSLVAPPPYLSVVTQDVGGSKLGYYLRREVSYQSVPSPEAVDVGVGAEDQEDATVTVKLTNTAPAAGLPPYVTARADLPRGHGKPVGQLRSWVSIYLGPRASYSEATLDGRPVPLTSEVESGLAVFSTFADIDPGQTLTLVLHVRQPAVEGSRLLWRQQPRLQPDALHVVRKGSPHPLVAYYEP